MHLKNYLIFSSGSSQNKFKYKFKSQKNYIATESSPIAFQTWHKEKFTMAKTLQNHLKFYNLSVLKGSPEEVSSKETDFIQYK